RRHTRFSRDWSSDVCSSDLEPSTALDVVARGHLLERLRALARGGVTLVLVTHHVEEIVPEIGRVVLMQGGRVLGDGTPADMLTGERLSQTFGGPVRVWQEPMADGIRYLAAAGPAMPEPPAPETTPRASAPHGGGRPATP